MKNFLKFAAVMFAVMVAVALLSPVVLTAADIAINAPDGTGLLIPLFFGIAVDKHRLLPTISVPNTAADNVRFTTNADNNVRTERFNFRVRGQVDITVAGAGVRNRGSILAAITDSGFNDGGADKVVADTRLLRFIAEAFAPSPLPATRLAGVGVQAATQLEEIVPIFLAAPRTINLNDTKYSEANKQLQLQPFITPLRSIARLSGGAPTGTITNLTVTVEQVFDEMTQIAPWLTAYTRQVVQDVTGTNPALRIDMRGSRYIRALAFQQDSDAGEVSDIINGVVLRGDNSSVIGERAVPFRDLQQAQAYENGGALPDGYLMYDFCRYGRLTGSWNPAQDTNLRAELDVQPTGGGVTGSKVRVAMLEYEQTPVTLRPLPLNI